MKLAIRTTLICAMLAAATTSMAQRGETVKIAWIDPLSGLMAAVGTNQFKTTQFLAEEFNRKSLSGVKFEILGLDNKLSPQETLSALRSAQDQGARYVMQGNGSGPALAIIDSIEKNNARNPGKEMLFMNYAAVDPDLTNSKCSYWHFRVEADTSMKMEAFTTWMKEQPDIKKVYILGQNYAHGVQVSKYAKEGLKLKRPDVQIVGDDLHPLAQVRDFSPYISKIKQSGADSVITGNWGSDLSLLLKAANDAGLNNVKFLTYYAYGTGTPTAMGSASEGKVFNVAYAHANMGGDMQKSMEAFKKKLNEDLYQPSIHHVFSLLDAAFAQAKSTDPVKVAAALEGMKLKSFNGEIEMRKSDHQLQQSLYVTRWEKKSAKYPYDAENTGYTLAPVKHYAPYVSSTPTTCQMKRPNA
ncbi:branched-chain amino acid ABC transporter substrate-binding protein [Variovorax sp. Root411]|nr:branched-chain amino acid ABC transporter substrate-binding protein [Variovorax sp. Root411]KQW61780.1 branched-chain amino acid ABC transporter substrate-binding protein [Variovorax sp. Root411]